MPKRLRVLKSPWHTAHDHDLIEGLKGIADFDLLTNYTRRWDEKNRPIPENTKWITHFEKGKYDFAILNIDQQCSNPDLNKSILTKQMKEVIKEIEPSLPIVFINHGTPVYPERYPDGTSENKFISEQLKKEILDIVGDDFMVVNSFQASKDWGKGYPIIHGMEAKEWIDTPEKEPRVCSFVSQAGIGDRYYNRPFLIDVMDYLKEKYGISLQWINTPNCFNAKGIKDYKEFLGKSLVYFNGTYASPMPRSRTEAMLSGCCIVSTGSHGASDFIQDGYNGFLVPDDNVEYAGDLIAKLITNYKLAKEIGQRGKETAIKLFNRERYVKDWTDFIINELKIKI
jgi:glycosyltransferase involved in cell wall biosynthesis